MRFWEEMQEPANLQENHKIMLGNPDLVGEAAYQSTDLNRLRSLFGNVVQISTQSDLDAFRPQSGFAIVTMGDDIDADIKLIFGTDNNKIEIHAYTVAGTGTSAGDVYQEGVSSINGLTYRRLYSTLTGWTDFELAIDLSRKIDFIDWGDLAPYYTALIGRFYKVHGTGGDATSEYWYLCIKNFTGFQVDSDYTDTEYFYPIANGALADIALTRRIPFIDWESDLTENYSVIKGQIVRMNGTGGDATSVYYYICVDDITSTKTDDNPINKPELFYDISGRTSLRNRGDFADFGYGVVMVNDLFYNDKGCGYVCIQQVTYSLGGGNPPLLDTDHYRPLTTINTPQFAKDVPIDADIMLILDSTDYVWKRVPKSNLNEVHVGDSAPTHNEKVWIDNTADLLVYKSATTATITPNNTLKVDKYNSNYAGGNTVLIDAPIFDTDKNIDYDDERVVVIKNIKAGTVTFVIDTLSTIVGGVTYNYIILNGDTFDLDQDEYAEISYLYTMTSATTCDVLIRIAT